MWGVGYRILVIDVGNTNIVVGAFEGDTLIKNWRISTDYKKSADEMGLLLVQLLTYHGLHVEQIESVVISSVVPQVMFSLERAVRRYLKHEPLIITKDMNTGIRIRYDNPKDVGADRIVNAVAVHHYYPGNAIIIDFGTATTFCALTAEADYLGGVICPGIKISLDALIERTAKLPKIEIIRPPHVIGTNTVESMQAGMVYGYAGQIENIVRRMKQEMGGGDIHVIATGGIASLIKEATNAIDILDSHLTLKGLKILYDRNKE